MDKICPECGAQLDKVIDSYTRTMEEKIDSFVDEGGEWEVEVSDSTVIDTFDHEYTCQNCDQTIPFWDDLEDYEEFIPYPTKKKKDSQGETPATEMVKKILNI